MTPSFLVRDGRPSVAYRKIPASAAAALPTVVFLGGFRSDMEGTKALFLENAAKARGQGFIRFDYTGHGASEGRFGELGIGDWVQDALDVIDRLTDGPVVLAGSSMGGWIALNCALMRPDRVSGVLGIAAAPDFTRGLRARMSPDQARDLERLGYFEEPNAYAPEPYRFTRILIDGAEPYCLLDRGIDLRIPVRLVQGMRDDDVEWQTAHRIRNAMIDGGAQTEITLIETGDHRLSRPEDLALIDAKLRELSGA